MVYKIGDKLICKENIENIFGQPLFEKNKTYEILDIDTKYNFIVLNHILYGNEFGDFNELFINEYFIPLKKLRYKKLNKIKHEK